VSTARLPPLTALRAFESAGRALSFTLAAQELAVTPGAISRQIRSLEDYLGLQLFIRSGREVKLTDAGTQYLADLTHAFGQIRTATAQLTNVPDNAPLRVSTSMTFTMRWLMPRMMSFHSLYANSNLQLTMNLDPVDFQRDDLDATIKLGYEDTPHSVCRKLFHADLVAVCSPRLIEKAGPFDTLDVLDSLTLLHSTARKDNWSLWLSAAGKPHITGARRLDFESSSLAYQAAIAGVGIAIAQVPLVMEDLRSGVLTTPFPITAPDSANYNLIWPNRSPRNPLFFAFRDWMLQEARQTADEAEAIVQELQTRRQESGFVAC